MHLQCITFYRVCDAYLTLATTDIPADAQLYGDKAYTDYELEKQWLAARQITLLPIRKSNSRRQYAVEVAKVLSHGRKRIETTFSRSRPSYPIGLREQSAGAVRGLRHLCAEKEKIQTAGG